MFLTQVEREFLHRHGEPALRLLHGLCVRRDAFFAGTGHPDISASEKRELQFLMEKWEEVHRDLERPTCPQGA